MSDLLTNLVSAKVFNLLLTLYRLIQDNTSYCMRQCTILLLQMIFDNPVVIGKDTLSPVDDTGSMAPSQSASSNF